MKAWKMDKCFLTGRKQVVIVNGRKSQLSHVISGVPQGTVLGPLLFLIFISDILLGVEANMKVYVDDTKIKQGISNEGSVKELQKDLEKLYKCTMGLELLGTNKQKEHVIITVQAGKVPHYIFLESFGKSNTKLWT